MEHKEGLLQWLLKLESYAKGQGVSVRILDTIREYRKHVQTEDISWGELEPQIEQILESVRFQTGQEREELYRQDKNSVPVEKVKLQVKKMADQCRKENIASVTNAQNSKDACIKGCLRKMEEISQTEKHLKELLDGNSYLDFFLHIQSNYERDMKQEAGRLIEDINNNYGRMASQMRSMFQDIGGYADGVGNETFYREYGLQKEGVGKRIAGGLRTEDFGSGTIMEFARRTKEGIRKIVKKLHLKKVFLACLPCLLLLLIFFGTAFIKYQNPEAGASDAAAVEEQKENGTGLDETIEKVQNNETFRSVLAGIAYVAAGMLAALGSVLVFLVLLLIVLYAFYIRRLNKWYRRRVCRESGEYLRMEFGGSGQERAMYEHVGQVIENIAEEFEQQYLAIWNSIFMGTRYEDKDTEDVPELEAIQREWDRLRCR